MFENMEGSTSLQLRLLALFPHPDMEKEFRKLSKALFEAGFSYSLGLPPLAPLASLTKALRSPELSKLASLIAVQNNSKIFETGALGISNLSETFPSRFLGLKIETISNLDLPEGSRAYAEPLLLLSLVSNEIPFAELIKNKPLLEIEKERTFRTAYIANVLIKMSIGKNSCHLYEWKIGKKYWLTSGRS